MIKFTVDIFKHLTIDDVQYKGDIKTFFLDCDFIKEQHDYVFHDEDGEKIEYKCRLCDKKTYQYKDEVE